MCACLTLCRLPRLLLGENDGSPRVEGRSFLLVAQVEPLVTSDCTTHNSSLWDGWALGKAPEATRTAWNANHVASVAAESTRLKASDLRVSSTFEPYHSTCTMSCRWPSTAVVGGKALLRNHCNEMTEIEWDEITCDHLQNCQRMTRLPKLSRKDFRAMFSRLQIRSVRAEFLI